ncbi:MAG: hypothetical protein ACYTKC_22740, partial [Planctomycetota bacterium]
MGKLADKLAHSSQAPYDLTQQSGGVMINVAVLAGGRSPEHGISLWSARQVLLYLDRANVRPFLVK